MPKDAGEDKREAPWVFRAYPEVAALWEEDKEFARANKQDKPNKGQWLNNMIMRGSGRLQDMQIEDLMKKHGRKQA